jgi:hypothetical protein
MTRVKQAVLAVVVFASLLSTAGKKVSSKDFPLNVEIQSFQTRPAPDTPINYLGSTVLTVHNTEIIIQARIEGKAYMLSCTTAEVGCASILPGTWAGRWTSYGIEILGANPKGKSKKSAYRIVSASQ